MNGELERLYKKVTVIFLNVHMQHVSKWLRVIVT